MSQSVTIVGPNLPDSSKGSYHVHAAGCLDLSRGMLKASRCESYTGTFDSIQDVIEFIYEDIMNENEGDYATWRPYMGEFHFAPCVDLPENSPARLKEVLNVAQMTALAHKRFVG